MNKSQTDQVLTKMKLQVVTFLFFVAFIASVICQPENYSEGGGAFGGRLERAGSAMGKAAVSILKSEKTLETLYFFKTTSILFVSF